MFDTPTFQIVGLCKRQYYRIPSCAMRGARCWHRRTPKAAVKSRWSSPRFSRCDALLQADALLQTGCSCFLPGGGKPRARAPLMRRVQTGATTWSDTPTTSGGGIQEMIRVLHKHKGDDRNKGVGGFRAWLGGSRQDRRRGSGVVSRSGRATPRDGCSCCRGFRRGLHPLGELAPCDA